MGCAVGGARVRDAERQVRDLRKRLEEVERERSELRGLLEAKNADCADTDVDDSVAAKLPSQNGNATVVSPALAKGKLETAEATVAADLKFQNVDLDTSKVSKSETDDVGSTTELEVTKSEADEAAIATEVEICVSKARQEELRDASLPGTVGQAEETTVVERVPTGGAEAKRPVSKEAGDAPNRTSKRLMASPTRDFSDCEIVQQPSGSKEAPVENDSNTPVTPFDNRDDHGEDECSVLPETVPFQRQQGKNGSGDVADSALAESEATGSTCAPAGSGGGASNEGAGVDLNVTTDFCAQCCAEVSEVWMDSADMSRYCAACWKDYYGTDPPQRGSMKDGKRPLVEVEACELWSEAQLAQLWAFQRDEVLRGWPPRAAPPPKDRGGRDGEVWSTVPVRVRRDVVGPHARKTRESDGPASGEVLRKRYRVQFLVGEGHFTKAYLAKDLDRDGAQVCLKRHRGLAVEALADLMVIGKRLEEVDPDGVAFPRLLDAFYDLSGYTVESLVEGKNCLAVVSGEPNFFADLGNLRHVARGGLQGLALLAKAGVVHNDVKPDNLIWLQEPTDGDGACSGTSGGTPSVRIVDFGCARLDQIEEQGQNWSLAEGGAGHLGKWSPEMALRLPIGHAGDVWGLAISICELHCGRQVWRNETDTAEVVLAQALGLCSLREGLPSSMLRKSPLDVRQLYTPYASHCPRGHFPIRRNEKGRLETLRPARYGLSQVLGKNWREDEKKALLGEFLEDVLVVDPADRPSAELLLERSKFLMSSSFEADLPVSPTSGCERAPLDSGTAVTTGA